MLNRTEDYLVWANMIVLSLRWYRIMFNQIIPAELGQKMCLSKKDICLNILLFSFRSTIMISTRFILYIMQWFRVCCYHLVITMHMVLFGFYWSLIIDWLSESDFVHFYLVNYYVYVWTYVVCMYMYAYIEKYIFRNKWIKLNWQN